MKIQIRKTRIMGYRPFLLILVLSLFSALANAQTEFIKYKKYLIPISSGYPAGCEAMSATLKNILYIDDIGELDATASPTTSTDPNGMLDLAIVLSLSDRFNLIAVGVGIPGKGIGYTINSTRLEDIELAEAIVTKSAVVSSTTGQPIPVYAESQLQTEIIKYANCASASDPLIVVLGGPWFDLQLALAADSSIKDKIKVFGIGGSNTSGSVHNGTLEDTARSDVVSAVGLVDVTEIPKSDFAQLLTSTSGSCGSNPSYQNCGDADLNNFYTANLDPFLSGIVDSSSRDITSAFYTDELKDLNENASGGNRHTLRIADFTAVALAIGDWSASDVFDKSVMYPVIATALAKLPR